VKRKEVILFEIASFLNIQWILCFFRKELNRYCVDSPVACLV